ncbi:MAG: cytochrome P450 [Acidimicrobiia bacterium]|nr:cytochrome P450 [Acidimicrobiia bacterium]
MTVLPTITRPEINLSDIQGFWSRPDAEKEAAFALLRAEDPVSYHPFVNMSLVDTEGLYAVTRHEDILHVSKHPELFSSAGGITTIDAPPEFNEFFGSMIAMDDPRHARLRQLVSAGFTPRTMKRLEDAVRRIAAEIVDDVAERGECDFVTDVAAALPLRIICDLMDVPASQHGYVFDQTNVVLGAGDPEYTPEGTDIVTALLTAGGNLAALMDEVARSKEGGTGDDLTTALINAEVDGERLTHAELASFFVLLVVAGNETTRNAISHGMMGLCANPDQRAIWAADFDGIAPTAVDEIVRWASPVTYMRRTTAQPVTLAGAQIGAGEKVQLFYWSANRDEAVFADPYRFDVRRSPNPHVGFGGPGPHFCLGAHLARREITVMFREIFGRLGDLEMTGEPEMLLSAFIHGVKHLPCRFTPSR